MASRLSGKGGPDLHRHPARLSPDNAAFLALGIIVHGDRFAAEPRPVVQGIDDDDRPWIPVIIGDSRDVDTAVPADQIVGCTQAEPVSLQSGFVPDRDGQPAVGIGDGARAMLDAERTLAGADFDLRRIELG